MKTNRPIQFILMMLQLLVLLFTMTVGPGSHAQTVTYIHTDGLGSPVAKSDVAGNLVANSRTRYEPYGMAVAGTVTPTIGFTGHVNDADTGLTYMQQRYYDPIAGRFLSTDPVLTDYNTGASFNRYTYAENNPYRFIDPDGRSSQLTWSKNKKSVTVTIQYAIKGNAQFTPTELNAEIKKNMSGTVKIDGTNVKVNAVGVNVALDSQAVANGQANVITIDPKAKGSTTNEIGGNQVNLRVNASAANATHELGHAAGAGDQYPGGIDSAGQRVQTAATTNNLMGDVKGPVNSQTLKEIIKSPTAEVTNK